LTSQCFIRACLDEQRADFLEMVIAFRSVNEGNFSRQKHFCSPSVAAPHAPDKLDEFIDTINSKLQPMFMQIRKGMSEVNGHQYYVLVNMAETDVTRMSSDYADNELELFRRTVDLIVCSENGKASSTDILNSTDTMTTKKLKKSETEHLLSRLVHDKWLCEVSRQDLHPLPEKNRTSDLTGVPCSSRCSLRFKQTITEQQHLYGDLMTSMWLYYHH
uniref:Non-structural maintenance of chromosomes element 1 homolog n=1 Tax=Oryzias sinensis TaxID=183150 RepID=A0A8C7YCK6_9TELE